MLLFISILALGRVFWNATPIDFLPGWLTVAHTGCWRVLKIRPTGVFQPLDPL